MQNATSWFSAKPKWFRVSTYLVLFYLTYALLLGVVTPAVLEAKLPNLLKENTGRNATVQDIAINPFLLKVGITDFVIYSESRLSTTSDSDEQSNNSSESDTKNKASNNRFFSVGNVSLDIGFWQTLLTLTPAIESLTIDSPYAKVARLNTDNDTKTFNFSDILAHLENRSTNEKDEEEDVSDGQIPRITLGQFILSNGQLVLEDEVTDTLLDYPELDVALQDLDTHAVISVNDNSQAAFNQYQFDLLTAEKGTVSIKGEFQLSPFKVATDVAISDVALAPLWSLSKDLVEAKLVGGTVNLSLQAQAFEEGEALQFLLENGEFAVNNLVFYSAVLSPTSSAASSSSPNSVSTSKEILAIPSFAVHDISVNGARQQVNIAKVALDDVKVSGLFDETGLDLQRLFTPKSLIDSATKTSAKANTNSHSESEEKDKSLQLKEQITPQLAGEITPESDNSVDAETVSLESKGEEMQTTAQTKNGSPELEQEKTWKVALQKFAFNNGTIDMLERSVSDGTYYRISRLDIESGEITTDFTKPISYTTSLQVSADTQAFSNISKGTLTSSGSLVIAEQTVKGKAAIEQLALNQFQQYISPYANVTLEEGLFNLNVEFDAAVGDEGTETLNVKANTKVFDLSVLDDAKEPLLQWQSLIVDDIDFNHALNQLSVDNVRLQSPFARLIIDEAKQTNVSKLVVASKEHNKEEQPAKNNIAGEPDSINATNSPASATNEKATSNAQQLAIAVNAISIENGKAYFADHSLTPKFASAIESLNGKVTGIDSRSDTPANVDINGKIDNYAPVKLAGTIHPLKSDLDLDLNFSVKGAELTSVNPYSGTYMGYYIDKGLLSLAVQYKLNGKALEGKNHVVIDQLTLGKKSNSDQALSLPLGLAIALLEDSNGVIDLGLDVSGDVDSPDFSFGSIILNAIGNIITKAVTAPFSLLANLVGSDDELDSVAFTFGEHKLNTEAKEKLNTLAEALKKRPGLRVNIEGTVNAVSDSSTLAQRQLNATLFAKSGLVNPTTTSGSSSTNGNTSAGGDIENLSYSGNPQDEPLTGSRIPLEGPLADALLSHYVEMFTPDLDQEYKNMVAQLNPELASEGEGQNGNDDFIDAINEEDVQRALTIARYNKLRNSIDIPESELIELADLRSKAVKSYLANQGEVEANRLFLLNTQHDLHTEVSGVELTLEAN
ncbi:DUF748 domain-containing protein [Alteromonas macleodii]|uniref:Outer membrane protein/peptidoglycan-associated (Lipo)protein n=1 Tax=Alteromonas macleodii TaxID=28108 RepID=A0A6T9Y4W9_ALTMA|nr:DUF748 domain-containing protein [Alteromonas macleodii]CAB9494873.1 Outer membrane protein/peptidoglycan-associated (Lipo)protein [Alteromonas macleodii]